MRKLNKSIIKAKAYQKWHDEFIEHGKDFDQYNSSTGKYYGDIVAELLLIQDGLCAYTERLLYNVDEIKALEWEDGKLKSLLPKVEGDLEHFDPSLKKKQGWLWSNFFMANEKVNRKEKGQKPVDYILKPDEDDYDPFRLMEYDFELHQYKANSTKLNEADQKRVDAMIILLGINSSPTRDLRTEKLNSIINRIELEIWNWANNTEKQFPTAIEMTKRQIINTPNP